MSSVFHQSAIDIIDADPKAYLPYSQSDRHEKLKSAGAVA